MTLPKAWHCSLLWAEFGFLVVQRRMWLKGLSPASPTSCLPSLCPFPASLAADCVSFQRVSPQWWDSPRGFLSPLLSSDPPHMSPPRSRGSSPPTCPRMALGPTCHQVSAAGAGDRVGIAAAAASVLCCPTGGWGCHLELAGGSLGWGGGHSACGRAAPRLYSKGGVAAGWGLPNEDLGSPTMCRGAHLFVFLIHRRILPTPRPPPPHGLLPCPRPLPLSWWPHGHSAGAPGSCHHGHSAAGRDLPGSPCADCVSPLPASHHHQDLLRDWAHELPSGLLLLLRGVGAASRAGASCWVLSLGNPVLVALAERWARGAPWHRGGTGAAEGFLGDSPSSYISCSRAQGLPQLSISACPCAPGVISAAA